MKAWIIGNLLSKTSWASLALVVVGWAYQNGETIVTLIPEEYRGIALSAVGLVFFSLRQVTTKPVTEKRKAKE